MNLGRWIGLTVLLCCLAVHGRALTSDDADAIYPMPMAEAREIATRWMEQNGFQVYQFTAPWGANVELTAEKESLEFGLVLEPKSPLATHVRFQSGSNDAMGYARALKSYLDDYLRLPQAPSSKADAQIPLAVRTLQKAAVCIYAANGKDGFQVSGFVLDNQGLIVSTAHDLVYEQRVRLVNHEGLEFKGQVIRIDMHRDLALIRTEAPMEHAVSLHNGRYLLRTGEALFAITCPANSSYGIQNGFLDGPPRRVQGLPLWQVQMHIDHGSSGSPVFDSQGRLTAMVKGRLRGTDSVGFLIPFETLLNFLKKY